MAVTKLGRGHYIVAYVNSNDPVSGEQADAILELKTKQNTDVLPDLKVIIDPSNAPGSNAIAVGGIRLRTLY